MAKVIQNLWFLLLVAFGTEALRAEQAVYQVDKSLERLDILHPAALFDQAEWATIPARMQSEGTRIDARYLLRGKGPVWIHFTVDNAESVAQNIILHQPFALTTRFDLYAIDAVGSHAIGTFGDMVPDREPQVWHRTPSITWLLQPGRTEFYMRVAHDNPQCLFMILYSEKAFHAMHARDLSLLCTLIGVIVVMLLYNVFIYLSLRYDYYRQYVGFGFSFYLCYVIISGLPQSMYFNQSEFRNGSIYFAASFGCLSFYFICQFLNSFLKVDHYFPAYARITRMAGLSIFVLLPAILIEAFTTETTYSIKIVNFGGAAIGTWAYYVGVRVAMKLYASAYYFLIAFTTLVIGNTYSNLVIDGYLPLSDAFAFAALFGGSCEILLLSISLVRRVKAEDDSSKRKIETMATELTVINRNLDQQVEERTRFARSILNNISVGLLRIEAHGLIAGDFSRSSLELFGVDSLRDKAIWDLLECTADERTNLQSMVELMIGEDQLNLAANDDLLPKFFRKGERVIELNWSPFLNEHQVEALLLLARDVTYIRQLEKEHQDRSNEADFIMVVARYGVTKITQYLEDESITLNRILELMLHPQKNQAELLRLVHTVKGNTRTFGLNQISQKAHKLEDELLIGNNALELIAEMRDTFKFCEETIGKYFASENQRVTRPLLDLEAKIRRLGESRQPDSAHLAEEMQWIISSMKHDAVEDLKGPMQELVHDLARQLKKSEPQFVFTAPGILAGTQVLHRLRSILNHLLRNAMDHGIAADGGHIEIRFHAEEYAMVGRVWDDGPGLNLHKLWQKAVEQGLFDPYQQLRIGDVAELVFNAGMSVKDQASSISGRGIGLDAVREFCRELGGTVRIHSEWDMRRNFHEGMVSMPISFEVVLPRELFLVAKSKAA